jgi:hypothetical protein
VEKRVRRREKVTKRKMTNMHLLETCNAIYKCGVKMDGKSIESDEKRA